MSSRQVGSPESPTTETWLYVLPNNQRTRKTRTTTRLEYHLRRRKIQQEEEEEQAGKDSLPEGNRTPSSATAGISSPPAVKLKMTTPYLAATIPETELTQARSASEIRIRRRREACTPGRRAAVIFNKKKRKLHERRTSAQQDEDPKPSPQRKHDIKKHKKKKISSSSASTVGRNPIVPSGSLQRLNGYQILSESFSLFRRTREGRRGGRRTCPRLLLFILRPKSNSRAPELPRSIVVPEELRIGGYQ